MLVVLVSGRVVSSVKQAILAHINLCMLVAIDPNTLGTSSNFAAILRTQTPAI